MVGAAGRAVRRRRGGGQGGRSWCAVACRREVPPDPTGRPLLVTTPHAEVSTLGGRFAVYVDAASTRLDVGDGHAELARLGGGGPTVVGAAQYAMMGERGDTLATPMSQGGAAMLVAGTLTLSPADERVRKRLESHGFEVQVQRGGPPRAEDMRRARIIVISSTASARDMSAHYRDLGMPDHRVGAVFIRRSGDDRRRAEDGPRAPTSRAARC